MPSLTDHPVRRDAGIYARSIARRFDVNLHEMLRGVTPWCRQARDRLCVDLLEQGWDATMIDRHFGLPAGTAAAAKPPTMAAWSVRKSGIFPKAEVPDRLDEFEAKAEAAMELLGGFTPDERQELLNRAARVEEELGGPPLRREIPPPAFRGRIVTFAEGFAERIARRR